MVPLEMAELKKFSKTQGIPLIPSCKSFSPSGTRSMEAWMVEISCIVQDLSLPSSYFCMPWWLFLLGFLVPTSSAARSMPFVCFCFSVSVLCVMIWFWCCIIVSYGPLKTYLPSSYGWYAGHFLYNFDVFILSQYKTMMLFLSEKS